jgi:hypothetical protein
MTGPLNGLSVDLPENVKRVELHGEAIPSSTPVDQRRLGYYTRQPDRSVFWWTSEWYSDQGRDLLLQSSS